MNNSEVSSDKHDTTYDLNRVAKLREARSAIGWAAVFLAVITVAPSIYDGLRHGVWISGATIICAVTFVGNLLVYGVLTRRLRRLTELGVIPNQKQDSTSASGPSIAEHEPR